MKDQQIIGILQADGKIPNIALMKIANYHKLKGDFVEWYKGNLFSNEYDKIYCSKLFSFTKTPDLPESAIIGGTGIDFYNKLPDKIEQCDITYSIYPKCNYHMGFTMKGCRFACKFCCVPKKEGRPYNYNTIDELLINPIGEDRLMLLDNDFFGGLDWHNNLKRIIELKLKVCFVQGLNIRIITPTQAELLAQCNYKNSTFKSKYLTFAWDKLKDEKLIEKGIEICNNAGIKGINMQFFVLIGFDTTPDEDYYRVMTLYEKWGSLPFVMPYNKSDNYQKSFARWVNRRAIFTSVTWESYKRRFRIFS